jgi:hypothetical protein
MVPIGFRRSKMSDGDGGITDAWLVEVASHNRGGVATLDQRLKAHDPSGKLVVLIA